MKSLTELNDFVWFMYSASPNGIRLMPWLLLPKCKSYLFLSIDKLYPYLKLEGIVKNADRSVLQNLFSFDLSGDH